jgi:integrase
MKGTLKVERQLERPRGEGVQFSAPKTAFGKRSIKLGSKTIEVLRRHSKRQQDERIAAGETWKEYDLIFPTSVGTPIDQRSFLRTFKLFLKHAGLPPIRFHDIRHTSASLMLNHDIPVIIVSRRLGHARASITSDVYGHLLPNMQDEAAEMIDDLVTPTEVGLNEPIFINNALHTVAHGASKDQDLQHNLSIDPYNPSESNKKPAV